MSRDAGVLRDGAGLTRLLNEIGGMAAEFGRGLPLVAAALVAAGALQRRESRGAHVRLDYPATAAPRRTVLTLAQADAISAEASGLAVPAE
jgi:L-aspartate oxidase